MQCHMVQTVGWTFRSVDSDEPLMWWTKSDVDALLMQYHQNIVHEWSWLFSQNASFVMRSTIELWDFRVCRILYCKICSICLNSTTELPGFSAHWPLSSRLDLKAHSLCQRPGGLAPPELPLSQQKCLFSPLPADCCWGWKRTDRIHL